jgi:hypothetical protein
MSQPQRESPWPEVAQIFMVGICVLAFMAALTYMAKLDGDAMIARIQQQEKK